jgi:hypothetical protein
MSSSEHGTALILRNAFASAACDVTMGYVAAGLAAALTPEVARSGAFLAASIALPYSEPTPKDAEESPSGIGLWVGIIAAVVVGVGLPAFQIARSRRSGPATEE